jgi:glycosyltransferase involved in cell wall biosynthesis
MPAINEQVSVAKAPPVKVSVVVPVYNVEAYLRVCLESLVHQTLPDIEIILIDDASTDLSGAVCDAYAAVDGRIRVVHHACNLQQGASRNEGIDLAQGEYVGFVDPDDWVDLDFFEKLYREATLKRALMVKTAQKETDASGSVISLSGLNRTIRMGVRQKKPLFLLFTFEHVTAIYRRDFLVQYGIRYACIRNAEDDFFLLQAGYFSDNFSLIDDTFYYYRRRPHSVTTARGRDYYDSLLDYFDLFMGFVNARALGEKHHHAAIGHVLGLVNGWLDELDGAQIADAAAYQAYFLERIRLKIPDYPCTQPRLAAPVVPDQGFLAQAKSLVKRMVRRIGNRPSA